MSDIYWHQSHLPRRKKKPTNFLPFPHLGQCLQTIRISVVQAWGLSHAPEKYVESSDPIVVSWNIHWWCDTCSWIEMRFMKSVFKLTLHLLDSTFCWICASSNNILVRKLFHDNFLPNFGQLINCRIVYVTVICVENLYSWVNRAFLGITFISIKKCLIKWCENLHCKISDLVESEQNT